MKKFIVPLTVLVIAIAAGSFWLLSQTTPDKAPQTEVTIDLTDRVKD